MLWLMSSSQWNQGQIVIKDYGDRIVNMDALVMKMIIVKNSIVSYAAELLKEFRNKWDIDAMTKYFL